MSGSAYRVSPGGGVIVGPDHAEGVPAGATAEPRLELWFWGLCIFLLTSPFVYQLTGLDPSQEFARDPSTLRRTGSSGFLLYVIRYAVMSATIVPILPHWREAIARLPRIAPALLFVGWAATTLFWTDGLTSSFNAILALVSLVVVGYCLALRLPPHLFARSFVYAGVFVIGFSILYVIFLPHFGIHQATDAAQSIHAGNWRGEYPHKNLLGGAAAVSACMAILAGPRVLPSRLFKYGFLAVTLLVIVKTGSATALALTCLVPILALFFVALDGRQRMLALVVLLPLAFAGFAALQFALGLLGRDLTLTGRTDLWAIAPDWIARRPFTGYGYASTTYGGFMLELWRRYDLLDPHNGYVNLVLGTGITGLALFLWAAFSTLRVARTLYVHGDHLRQAAIVVSGLLSAWLVACLTESQDKPLGAFAAFGFCGMGLMVYRDLRVTR